MLCEDGVDPDSGGPLFRDTGKELRDEGPRPGPPAKAGQRVVIQSHYDGNNVPFWRDTIHYQVIEEPIINMRKKRWKIKG
jgi:hypothetical protein